MAVPRPAQHAGRRIAPPRQRRLLGPGAEWAAIRIGAHLLDKVQALLELPVPTPEGEQPRRRSHRGE
jgi:hypothetical protein